MICPQCNGEKYIENPVLWKGIGGGEYYPCPLCNKEGEDPKNEDISMQNIRRRKEATK